MPDISVDFDVWKALTALRREEAHSYNDVLRSLLDLPAIALSEASNPSVGKEGRFLGNRWMPDGTELRAKYKGQVYEAAIRDGRLIDAEGLEHSSASAAAKAITGTSVNGLTFWSVKRPMDVEWKSLLFIGKDR